MTNLQLLLSISIPTIAVIVSMVINNGRFNSIESRLISIEADLRRFYSELGRHAGEIEILRERSK